MSLIDVYDMQIGKTRCSICGERIYGGSKGRCQICHMGEKHLGEAVDALLEDFGDILRVLPLESIKTLGLRDRATNSVSKRLTYFLEEIIERIEEER